MAGKLLPYRCPVHSNHLSYDVSLCMSKTSTKGGGKPRKLNVGAGFPVIPGASIETVAGLPIMGWLPNITMPVVPGANHFNLPNSNLVSPRSAPSANGAGSW